MTLMLAIEGKVYRIQVRPSNSCRNVSVYIKLVDQLNGQKTDIAIPRALLLAWLKNLVCPVPPVQSPYHLGVPPPFSLYNTCAQ